jgi:acetyl esterase
LAGQILIYPATDSSSSTHASRAEFAGTVISAADGEFFWSSYTGGRTDLGTNPFAAPLHAASLAGLPPALVVLGGCDFLRDEGRAFAARLRIDGVDTTEICFSGQPHGFINLDFPAAAAAYERIGAWSRDLLAR